MTNASTLYNLAFNNKRKIDGRYGTQGYQLMAEAISDADFREAGDLPPVCVVLGAEPVPDRYGVLELNQEQPRAVKIDFSMTDEAMLLRIVIDRLSRNKAPDELIDGLKALVPEAAKHSKRAVRPPDQPKKPKTTPTTDSTKTPA